MSEEPVDTDEIATETTESEAPETPDEPGILVVSEIFSDPPDPLSSISSGPGEETNTDIWTQ